MRVCVFGSEIGPVKKGVFVGGATVSAVRLSQALCDLGNDIFIFSSAPRGRPSKVHFFDWGIIVNKRIPGRYMSSIYLLLYGITSFFGLLKFCKRNKIDVLSSHSGSILLCVVPSVVGKLLRIPVFHTQYCEVSKQNNALNIFFKLLSNPSYFMPNKFVAISKNVFESILTTGFPKEKIIFIPPVVPSSNKCDMSSISYRNNFGFRSDESIVLFVGNLKRNKGIDVLLESFVELEASFPNLNLIITTELIHKDMLDRKNTLQSFLVQHGLTNRVIWLGFVDEMLELIRNVDVVCVPFLNLNGISDYPLVVLEAMSVGTPVVATDVGGISEVLSENFGVLVQSGDVASLSKGIVKVLSTRCNCKNRLNLTKMSLTDFDSVVVGRQYQALFIEEVAKND